MKPLKISGYILSGIQLIISIVAIYFAMSTKLVPFHIGIIASIILVAIPVGIFFMARMESKKVRILAIVLSSIFIIGLSIATYYIYITNKAMDKVVGKTTEVDEINVYVAKEDEVASINEAVDKGYKFGIVATDDSEHIQETVRKVEDSVGEEIETVEYDSIFVLIGAFENGVIQSIITSKGTLAMADASEETPDFSKGLKVIMENTITEEIEEENEEVSLDHFCIYFSGIDTFGSVTAKSRSDVNIIGVVNTESKEILLVSTPRDYYVQLQDPNKGKMDKLTHAGLYGIESSMHTLENLYGTNLSYYVRLNFSGFQNIIDQIGGIDVNSEYSFESITEEGQYQFSKGVNHLNGEQALGYVRARYAFTDGDRQRGRNQMQVIKATIEKLESPESLKNYSGIMDSLEGLFQTDMSKDDVGYLVQKTLDNGEWTVLTYSVSGSDSEKSCFSLGSAAYVMTPNDSDVKYGHELIERVLAGENVTQDEINVYIESKDQEDLITEEKPTEGETTESSSGN